MADEILDGGVPEPEWTVPSPIPSSFIISSAKFTLNEEQTPRVAIGMEGQKFGEPLPAGTTIWFQGFGYSGDMHIWYTWVSDMGIRLYLDGGTVAINKDTGMIEITESTGIVSDEVVDYGKTVQ